MYQWIICRKTVKVMRRRVRKVPSPQKVLAKLMKLPVKVGGVNHKINKQWRLNNKDKAPL